LLHFTKSFFIADNIPAQSSSAYIISGIVGTSSKEWLKADGSNSYTYKFILYFKGALHLKSINKSFVALPKYYLMAKVKELTIYSSRLVYQKINKTYPLSKRFGKPINEIYENGRAGADAFI
jgi:hypothetical protein